MDKKSNRGIEIGRPMPQSIEAERSVLGGILLNNSYLAIASEKLKPEDFFHSAHHNIFYQMIEMGKKQMPIDLVTLTDELHRADDLEASGGPAYLAQLMDGVPHLSNVEHYARIVKQKATLRGLIHVTHAIQQQALEAEDDPEEILGRAKNFIDLLSDEGRSTRGLVEIRKVASDSFSRIDKLVSGGANTIGLATGYPTLDIMTAGLQPSELILLAARPSQGKSSYALNITENVAIQNRLPVAIFSLEMSAHSLFMRLLGSRTRIDSHKFRTGHLTKDELTRIPGTIAEISESPIWIDDSSSCSMAQINSRSQRLKQEHGLSLIIVDYIQLIAGTNRRNRQEEVSEISRALKALAKNLQVPVLALSQLTRAPEQESRRPQLSDLRESGALEQDSDVVLFIHRPKFYKTDESPMERAKTELLIAKQRNGPTTIINFVFLEQYTRFEEAAPETLWDEA